MGSINLAEIQQKQDRLLYNMAEQNRKFYDLFFNPNPQDVSLPQLDENGNLVTVNIPNRMKIRDQIWADAQSAMSKTYYVDAINGSDTNDGLTETTPFQTLQKAIDSVPVGGKGLIYVISDYELNERVSIESRNISLILLSNINFSVRRIDNTTYQTIAGFNISLGKLSVTVQTPNFSVEGLLDTDTITGSNLPILFRFFNTGDTAEIQFRPHVDATYTFGSRISIFGFYGGDSFNKFCVGSFYCGYFGTTKTFVFDSASTRFFQAVGAPTPSIAFGVGGFGFTLVDTLGNPLKIGDVFGTLVTDASGSPLNVVSNVDVTETSV